jgi:hypothetical protein
MRIKGVLDISGTHDFTFPHKIYGFKKKRKHGKNDDDIKFDGWDIKTTKGPDFVSSF